MFNIRKNEDWGCFVGYDGCEDRVPLVSCDPVIEFYYAKNDTVIVGLNFKMGDKIVMPLKGGNLEFYFKKNQLITFGNQGNYLVFDEGQVVEQLIKKQKASLDRYKKETPYQVSKWLKCN